MDVCLVIKRRLEELDLEQRDLAIAATVTESYISQLLTRKKMPPASDRTDIYEKMSRFLKFPVGKLAQLADLQRKEELKKSLADPPAPLLRDVRELILRKCSPNKRQEARAIFERQPFGELERFVTQTLLDVVKRVAREELENENWLLRVGRLVGRSYEQMRVTVLEFLDTDIFNLSMRDCNVFLDPLIESWNIDLATFAMEIVLNRRFAQRSSKKLEFVERESIPRAEDEPGFKRFLRDRILSGDASQGELVFLKCLRFDNGRRPTALYYYRELQNLRDPLHFRSARPRMSRRGTFKRPQAEQSVAPLRKHVEADGIEKQLQADKRKNAIARWVKSRGRHGRKRKTRS